VIEGQRPASSVGRGTGSLDVLRLLAREHGVDADDADLERVQAFLDVILPALAKIEERLPPETPPA
jgi:hypothetical protein